MANMIFNLDLNKNNAINPIIFGRLTDGNLRKITVNITNNGEPVDLTDWVIRFEGTTGGQAKVFDVMGVHLLDAENGKFEYTFSKTAFSASGAYRQAYFAIEKDNMRETTNDIKIVVENIADLDAQDAETVVTELNKTITLINQKYDELNGRVDIYEGDIAELESWLDERKAEIENIIDLANSNFNEKLTEIQAKLDETNQAIEKGNETIAYAYSADGTDRFVTTYPNINLLSNSLFKNPIMTTPDSDSAFYGLQSNVVGSEYVSSTSNTDLTISSLYVAGLELPIGVYTSSITIANNSETVAIVQFVFAQGTADTNIRPIVNGNTVSWWFSSFGNPGVTINIPPKSKEVYTLTFTAKSTNNTAGGRNQFLVFRETTAIPVTRYSKPKLEQGSVATSWMPSSSEVTTADYPSYIGYSNTVKTNKVANDYKWFPTITSHINDKSNPHAVTAEQVNAYTKTVTFTKTEIQDLLSDAIAQSKLDANPIGSIITTISNTNPSTYLGGTWERFANGRTLVGVDETDDVTLMKTANNTGGSVNPLTRHSHNIRRANGTQQSAIGATISWSDLPNNGGVIQESGDNTNHNNWQPFATVYFWKRTA